MKEYRVERNPIDEKYRVVDQDGCAYGGAWETSTQAFYHGKYYLKMFPHEYFINISDCVGYLSKRRY